MKVDILGILSFLADLSPFLFYLFNRSLIKGKVNWLLFSWCSTSVFLDIMVVVMPSDKIQSIAFYTVLGEPFFVIAIYCFLVKKKIIKYAITLSILLFVIFISLNSEFLNLNEFSNTMATLSVLLVLILSFLMFIDLYNVVGVSMLENPSIFIFLGYIIYTSGTLFLFATTDKFPNIFQNAGYWSIFLIANIFKNIFLMKYIFEYRKKELLNQ